MKVVVAYYGYYEHVSDISPNAFNSWKPAWPFFKKNVYEANSEHEVASVFHTWAEPTVELLDAIKPSDYLVGEQKQYPDTGIHWFTKLHWGYRSYAYNNLKNRLVSMKQALQLANRYDPDVVLLTRFDNVFDFPVILKNLELGNNIHAPYWNKPDPDLAKLACDHYYVATPQALSRFMNVGDSLTDKTFEPSSEYSSWLRSVGLQNDNLTSSHVLIRWMFDKAGLVYKHYGIEGKDTCVARHLPRLKLWNTT